MEFNKTGGMDAVYNFIEQPTIFKWEFANADHRKT